MTSTSTVARLDEAALEQYRKEGFYHAKGVLPLALLDQCRQVLEKWVDQMAATWEREGLIADRLEQLDFRTRFNALWLAAGKPSYHRSPRKDVVAVDPRAVFDILCNRALLDVAEFFLESKEICSHGVWNTRPKTPDSRFTDTPWHQDGQYFPDQAHIHIMTLWFPLHPVDGDSSCLAVAPKYHMKELAEIHEWEESGFIGISPDKAMDLPEIVVAMEPGDALVFPQLTPHKAMSNKTDRMRWSMDLRFVDADLAMYPAYEQGFVARSADPSRLTSYDEWLKKWDSDVEW